jgi:hypothetical protein
VVVPRPGRAGRTAAAQAHRRRIKALFASAATPGEWAAGAALERIKTGMGKTLRPEFEQLNATLVEQLAEVMARIAGEEEPPRVRWAASGRRTS